MPQIKLLKISALALVMAVSLAGAPALAQDMGSETEAHKHGQQMTDETHQQHKTTCEAHKQGLTKKFERIVNNSDKIKTHIDSVLSKAQTFQQENSLPVADYNTLVETALNSQKSAMDSITTLKAVQPTLDCNNVSVASDVAAFKTAAQDTRDKLKDYRQSVKAILKALHEAKIEDSSHKEGGTQ